MENKFEDEKILEKVDKNKRDFIKKVVVGTAFAVPVINSFSMEGLKINLAGKMERADEYDRPRGYTSVSFAGMGGGGGGGGGMGVGSC